MASALPVSWLGHIARRAWSAGGTTAKRAIEVKTNALDLAKKTGKGLRVVGAVRDGERRWRRNGGRAAVDRVGGGRAHPRVSVSQRA